MSRRKNDAGLLLIVSGIDLLLAALCAAVGILVLLMGSRADESREESLSSAHFARWWVLVIESRGTDAPIILCNGKVPVIAVSGDYRRVIVTGSGDEVAKCEVNGALDRSKGEHIDATIFRNDACWRSDGASPCKSIESSDNPSVVMKISSVPPAMRSLGDGLQR